VRCMNSALSAKMVIEMAHVGAIFALVVVPAIQYGGVMMDPRAMDPYGQALLAYLNGDTLASFVVRRDDGHADDLPVSVFFDGPDDFSEIDRMALSLCTGRVLDIGAGAGRHSLVLQERGVEVLAIDVCSQAIEVMRRRGVRECRCADLFEMEAEQFDTLLLMMHGVGMVEDLAGLDRFLDHAHSLVGPDGQILCHSLDVRFNDSPRHVAYREAIVSAGRYVGEIQMQFEYGGLVGPLFGWLHVDPETYRDHAAERGWAVEVVLQEDDGDYLARLTRS